MMFNSSFRSTIHCLFLVFLILGYGIPLTGQEKIFNQQQRYGVEDGLPQSFISGIIQDRDGFIWVGTLDGLSRFDGRSFTNFRNRPGDKNGLSSNAVAYLFPLAENKMAALYEGYHNDEFEMESFQVTRNHIRDQLRQHSNIIWEIASAGNVYNGKDWVFVMKHQKGIGWFQKATQKMYYANTSNGILADDQISALLQTAEGHVYLVSEKGVQVSDSQKKHFKHIPFQTTVRPLDGAQKPIDYFGGRWVSSLPDNQLAVTDYNRIVLLDLQHKRTTSLPLPPAKAGNPPEIPRLLQTDQEQQLYFEHSGRIFRLKKNGDFELLWQNTVAPQLNITACYIDRTDVLWLSVNAQGLIKIDLQAKPFDSYKYQTNFFVDILQQSGIPKSEFPKHWLGERESYFFRYAYDSKGRLFCSHNPHYGSIIWMREGNRLMELKGLANMTPVFSGIAVDPQDGIWAFDMMHAGWFYWSSALAQPIFLPLDESCITGINLGDVHFFNNRLWLSTYSQGLLTLNKTQMEAQFNNLLSAGGISKDLTEICPDPIDKNKFWVGSRGNGLSVWDIQKGLQKTFTTQDGLPNNTIYCILPDKYGNLWGSTNKGIFRMNPKNHQILTFEKSDGLPGNEFNRAHKFLFADGRLAFGGLEGYTIFNPDDFESPKAIPTGPLQITSIQINNENQEPGQKDSWIQQPLSQITQLNLPHDKNYIRIQFAALQFNQPEKIKYRYRLKGIDPNWIHSGTNNMAVYSALPPGTYQLLINATDYQGQWSDVVKPLTIKIRHPFWATWWAYLVYGLILAGLVQGYIKFRGRQNRIHQKLNYERKEALRLREMDEIKDRFFSNITHDFRTPLTMIISPMEKLIHNKELPAPISESLHSIQRSARQLLRLTNEFLDFSKLNQGQMRVNLATGDLVLFCAELVASFQQTALEKRIALTFETKNLQGNHHFDAAKIEKIIANLLGNALKFTPRGGKIEVSVVGWETQFQIQIKDNGPGIPSSLQSKVFERFYQMEHRSAMGTGIGLALVKDLTELMGGTVHLESEPTQFCIFRVTLPLMKAEGKEMEWESPPQAGSHHFKTGEEGPLILIVEDNLELRSFLIKSLAPSYRCSEAANGQEAREKIVAELPDIVISDVMMPVMDGYELCQWCKTDQRTAHIGFILLTSRAAATEKMKGLKAGADDFITKPFLLEELEMRVNNLLALQEKIRTELNRQLLSTQPTQTPTQIEHPFLQPLYSAIHEKLDDPALSVEYLCQTMAMSRSTLNRKLKSILNTSANDLVRQIRLQRATELLIQGIDITTVCYQVGFSSPSYFTQCFKEQYGTTPTQYITG